MNNLKILCVCGADLANKHKSSFYKPSKFAHVVAKCFDRIKLRSIRSLSMSEK